MSRWISSGCVWIGALVAAVAPPASVVAQAPAAAVVEITGASRLEFDEATGSWTAEGPVVTVTWRRAVLRASRVRYDQRARIVVAEGGVEITDPGTTLSGDAVELRLADDHVRATGAVRIVSTREAPPVELRARQVEGVLGLRTLTAAGDVALVRADTSLTGRRLDYDDAARTAVATGEPAARYRDATLTAEVVTLLLGPQVLRADGAAVLRRGELAGSARHVEVHARDNTVRLAGEAVLTRGRDRATADEIQASLDGSRIVLRGGSRIVVTPP